jgi:hypothetical protein
VTTVLTTLFGHSTSYQSRPIPTNGIISGEYRQRDLNRLLIAYYLNNSLYDEIREVLYDEGIRAEALKSLRNPAYRIVEFYAAKLWPGALPAALPIEAKATDVQEAIERIWGWSNWTAKKQVAVRWAGIMGEIFIKVAQRAPNRDTGSEGRVYLEAINPVNVTEFTTDERGFLTYIRIDSQYQVRKGKTPTWMTHTEIWSKPGNVFRSWEHEQGVDIDLDRLGTPDRQDAISDFGIDFIPIAYAQLRDIGEDRGVGAFTLALDKVDEVNRLATSLHQKLFRYGGVDWVVTANAQDKDGRPIPPPRVDGTSASGTTPSGNQVINVGSDRVWRMPGLSRVDSMVPNVNYVAALDILNAQLRDLEADCPEMAYDRVVDLPGEASGRAIRLRLDAAISRLLEARGNLEGCLARADMMALTLAAKAGLTGFTDLGDYEAGDFEHSFSPRDVIASHDLEDANARKARAEAAAAEIAVGVDTSRAIQNMGYSEEDADEWAEASESKAAERAEMALAAFDRGSGMGGQPGVESDTDEEQPEPPPPPRRQPPPPPTR